MTQLNPKANDEKCTRLKLGMNGKTDSKRSVRFANDPQPISNA